MIERLQLLRNIGQFDNVSPGQDTELSPLSFVYAENGRGKTTLAAVLRSLATGESSLITERKRLGSQNPPHVVVSTSNGAAMFQNGTWNQQLPDISIFDDTFVAENVCSGIELHPNHRQRLHELILGAQGVALNAALRGHVQSVEEHNKNLKALADEIPAAARGPYKPDTFCNLEQDPAIDKKLQDAERRFAAAKSADAIRNRAGFSEFSLPDFDLESISSVLGQTLDDLDGAAVEQVKTHFRVIGQDGEAWVAEGMPRIEPLAPSRDEEGCPFCAQDLSGSALIGHYRAYFSEAYDGLKARIRATGIAVRDAHAGDIPSAFERDIRTAAQTHEFWGDFAELPVIEIDTAAIAREWNAAREAVLDHLRMKAAAPLEKMILSGDAVTAVETFRARISEVAALSERLTACNDRIDLVKEQSAADDLAALETDLARLRAQKARFDPAVVQKCDDYLAEKQAKSATEAARDQARAALDTYRQQIFPAYESAINDYLGRFNASFRLTRVESQNTRAGSSASYFVVINQHEVDISAAEGPSFKNTLSAGDRNTLALAFFFAALEQDQNLAQRTLVIDDPMTSLDEHRSLCTRQEIMNMSQRVQQIIVLSHSKPFLCGLWEQADKNSRTAIRINRAAVGSELAVWDVRDDSITEHDKRHELVRSYLQVADHTKERQVAEALRPILEAFMRVAFPESFPPGTLLGPFIGVCEQRLGTAAELLLQADITELRALLNYANRFHHDTNPAWQTAVINDAELSGFAERTLLFASRR